MIRRVLFAAATTAAAMTAASIFFIDNSAGAQQSGSVGLSYAAPDQANGKPSSQRPRSVGPQIGGSQPSSSAAPAQPSRPGPSVGNKVLFKGDYETGDLTQWATCQTVILNAGCSNYAGKHHSISLVPGRLGKFAARFIVKDGDVPEFGGGERAEVSTDTGSALTHQGDERWYQWSMRLADDFPDVNGWVIFMQWHSGSGSPPLAVEALPNGKITLTAAGTGGAEQVVGPMRRGQWVDYVLHVKFSSGDDGFVEAWENGVKTVPLTRRATMTSDENYLKQGIYRDAGMSGTTEVLLDGLTITAP